MRVEIFLDFLTTIFGQKNAITPRHYVLLRNRTVHSSIFVHSRTSLVWLYQKKIKKNSKNFQKFFTLRFFRYGLVEIPRCPAMGTPSVTK